MVFNIQEIIKRKRDGFELTTEEIRFFTEAVVTRRIEDSQIGAMLMAFYLKKLSVRETVDLTKSMIDTGDILRFGKLSKDVLVDKHSTGGVGDKVSLILAPALAACGFKVPMISGRSLLFTGGTLDKLESVPGFQVNLSLEQMTECLDKSGCFICGATKNLVPADAILYQLRDLTNTADYYPLILSSILAKKASEGIGTLIMDVKFGKGSFFRTEEDALGVAQMLVQIGKKLDLRVRAVVSDMNVPLGQCVGNALEVVEAVRCLRNEVTNPIMDLVALLGGVVLEEKGLVENVEDGKHLIKNVIETKMALTRFLKMLTLQGVSEKDAANLGAGKYWSVLTKASHVTLLKSPKTGVVTDVDASKIGKACWLLAGGRITANSPIDLSVGTVFLKSVGSKVEENEPWVEVYHSSETLQPEVADLISSSLVVVSESQSVVYAIKTILVK